MDDIDRLIEEMEKGLDGTTPGPWEWNEDDQLFPKSINDARREARKAEQWDADCFFVGEAIIETDMGVYGPRNADRAHIARCSPDNIRALIAALKAARGTP